MNKTSYLIIAAIILLIGAILLTTIFQKNENNSTEVIYTDLNITFLGQNDNPVVAKNFLTDPSVVPDAQNPGMYTLGNTLSIEPATNKLPNYVVIYDKVTGTFTIALLQKPFVDSRKEAELYLKDLLKVGEREMCGLLYSVTVPGYVDQTASGFDYRFSFCSDATQL